MKISIIAWDANFRESLHTLDFFSDQDLEKDQYEFLWVDYYSSNDKVRKIIAQHTNFRLINLERPDDENWHLGKCINAGVAEAKGELLVIPDGDIVVERNFLSQVLTRHKGLKQLVTYHKRYDEPKKSACWQSKTSIDHLKTHAKLINPTNYAGCIVLRKESLLQVNGYETHAAFAGPGINGMETYLRLRNAGFMIKWEPEIKIYHPWHPSSGSSGHDLNDLFNEAKIIHPWLIPYAGLEQSWICHRREITCTFRASESECNRHLEEMPSLNFLQQRFGKKRNWALRNLINFFRA
jgi:hypothetical protein